MSCKNNVRLGGPNCDIECPVGKFYIDGSCKGICNCRLPSKCNVVTGQCVTGGCKSKFTGESCQSCNASWFGTQCKHRCNCLLDAVCHPVSGACADGCREGYEGKSCQIEKDSGMDSLIIVAIVVPIALLLAVVLVYGIRRCLLDKKEDETFVRVINTRSFRQSDPDVKKSGVLGRSGSKNRRISLVRVGDDVVARTLSKSRRASLIRDGIDEKRDYPGPGDDRLEESATTADDKPPGHSSTADDDRPRR